jgi:hypothetical protein
LIIFFIVYLKKYISKLIIFFIVYLKKYISKLIIFFIVYLKKYILATENTVYKYAANITINKLMKKYTISKIIGTIISENEYPLINISINNLLKK